MSWLRKSFVYLLSLILLVSLIGVAVATGTNLTLSEPSKVEKMLEDSKLYDSFALYAAEQAQKIAEHQASEAVPSTGAVPQTDPALKEAATVIFSPQFLKQMTTEVLNSNYAWLQGKTQQPDFTLDMTGAKQEFAGRVGQYVATRMSGLPVCTPAQLAQLPAPTEIDWLAINCRPPTLTAEAAGAAVTQQVSGSGEFLDNPQVNAQSIGPKDNADGQPYYVKLASLPKVYQFGQKLPFVAAILALLCLLGIVFINPRRRDGLKRVGIVLLSAGILLALGKFISDLVFNKLDKGLFNQSSVGPLQQSLVDFLHRVQQQIVTIELYFAAAYIILGAALWVWMRRSKPQPVTAGANPEASRTPPESPQPAIPRVTPPKNKPPRLIQ